MEPRPEQLASQREPAPPSVGEHQEECDEEEEEEAEGAHLDSDEYESPLDEADNEDADEGECGRPALPIDPSQLTGGGGGDGGRVGGPQNGHDYLQLVQEERERYPAVLRASAGALTSSLTAPAAAAGSQEQQLADAENKGLGERDAAQDEETTGMQVEANAGDEEEEEEAVVVADELDCVEEILVNFRRLRGQIEQLRAAQLTVDKVERPEPPTEAEFKRLQASGQSERRASNLLRLMELGQPPQVSSLLDKSQLELHMTLERLADECELLPHYSTCHTDWIYSLMACLREPIEPDICSSLRRLARLCASTGAPDSSSILIICIVRHHFGQTDLKYTGPIRHDPCAAAAAAGPSNQRKRPTTTTTKSKPATKSKATNTGQQTESGTQAARTGA